MAQTTITFSKGTDAETLTVEGTLGEFQTSLGEAKGGFVQLTDTKGRTVLVNPDTIKFVRERTAQPPLR